ncbi:MAG TPA: cell division protein SepF [Pseudonocardia sp.]
MGAMYKLKAYFGMVPAEELAEYSDEPERYAPAVRRTVRDLAAEHEPEVREREAATRWDDRYAGDDDRYEAEPAWDRRAARTAVAERAAERPIASTAARPTAVPPVRGALAIDPDAVRLTSPSNVPEQRERSTGPAALSRITTLQPTSYNEARTIGERYRDGIPVIMNLTELDDASAKRLVDFAAGLVFALRGGFDKVTNRVFLLTPADVEVSADDARKLVGRVGGVVPDRPRH